MQAPKSLRLLTKCGVQGDHPPAGVWGRAPKPYAAAFFVSVASVRRTQETRLFPKPWVFQRSEAPKSLRFRVEKVRQRRPFPPKHVFPARKYRRSARWPRAALVFAHACGAAGETCKETLLRKASEFTAHVAGFGIQLGGRWPSEPFKRVFCSPCRFVNHL